ncbi:MAG TPA: hypothetical protein VJP02_18965 [Candidatus Sulfotelmatobacter sp.]|nr:hypothetical protein [Candidatus Sulfotelmatobacter sp.]
MTADRHASLWENGRVIDLNIFLSPGSALQQLTDAYNINDRGEIVGLGVPTGCGDEFACGRIFVLIPCVNDDALGDEGCRDADAATSMDGIDFASVSASSITTAQTSLTTSEMRDRVHASLSRRNRQSKGLQPK